MTDDKRTEREIIAEAYSDEAQLNWLAPVQMERGARMYIPWAIHLEAYEAYCAKWGAQTALIDLEGRGCRGGFHTGELDTLLPGWRDRVAMFGKLKARVDGLDAAERERSARVEAMGEALTALSEKLRESGFLDKTENYLIYDRVAKAWEPF